MCFYATQSLGVFLSLKGDIIPNHGYVNISNIGFSDDTALLCNTDRPPDGDHSGGDWFAPDGDKVSGITESPIDVPGFGRNRGSMVVRLLRDTDTGTPPEGIYRCSIMDADGNNSNVYVGLYNDGQGNFWLY